MKNHRIKKKIAKRGHENDLIYRNYRDHILHDQITNDHITGEKVIKCGGYGAIIL